MTTQQQTRPSAINQHWDDLWQAIEKAGGRYQYVQEQLKAKGFLLERKPIDSMPTAERERYIKTLKAEAQEQKKLEKEAWQAYKANHIVYLGDGIYWSDDTSDDEFDVTDASKRLSENQLPRFKDAKELATALNLTLPRLKGLCFHREVATRVPYIYFNIAKRNGESRQISSPIPILKHAQRWILDNVLNPLMIHGSAHGFVKGKSIATNARIHTDSRLLIKLDIKDFFPSINWKRVRGVYRHAGYPEHIATLLALLCTESPRQLVKQNGMEYYVALGERCLPQGSPTSPALTNIICLNLDRRITGLCDKIGLRYSRYADDLTISLPNSAKTSTEEETALIGQIIGSIVKILAEENFVLNHKKTKVIRQNRQTVTGLVVNGSQPPRVPRHIKRTLRASIHNLEQGKPLRADETINRLQGYASWIAMTEPELGKQYLQRLLAIAKSQVGEGTKVVPM